MFVLLALLCLDLGFDEVALPAWAYLTAVIVMIVTEEY